ncbi:MAG: sulfatase [Candidatus Hydrogenedentota bacterium]
MFILTDDLRYDAISAFGNDYYQTPNLDALARKSAYFNNAFVTTSLCSPSRASILTGCYAHIHGVMNNSTALPSSLPTFAQLLQENGYETAFIGKWHMGGHSDAPRPGFDHWVSFRGQGHYKDPALNVDGQTVKKTGYLTDILTDYAINFIRKPHDRPFMLYLSHKAVHADFDTLDRFEGRFQGTSYPYPDSMADTEENYKGKPHWVKRQRNSWHGVDGIYNNTRDLDTVVRQTAETVLGLDENMGRLTSALREENLLDDTFLALTSDNGFMFGEHGLIDKRAMYEPSIRVPLFVHCPALIPEPRRIEQMVLNIDFAPTFLEIGRAKVPESMQGRSFLGLLKDPEEHWREDFLYEYFWERAFPQTPTVLGVRTDRYKFMHYHGIWDRYELYDLENDPQEMNNLLGDFMVETQAGSLDRLVAHQASEPVKSIYLDLQQRLKRLLNETGCAPEPDWRP